MKFKHKNKNLRSDFIIKNLLILSVFNAVFLINFIINDSYFFIVVSVIFSSIYLYVLKTPYLIEFNEYDKSFSIYYYKIISERKLTLNFDELQFQYCFDAVSKGIVRQVLRFFKKNKEIYVVIEGRDEWDKESLEQIFDYLTLIKIEQIKCNH